jgi:Transcriptional regulator, AbiEi antitoxin
LLPNTPIDAAISHSASRFGHVHYRQLRALGLSQRAIAARCQAGRLIRVFHEVYAVGHAQRNAIARADAAVLACGPRAALSHDSAAASFSTPSGRSWSYAATRSEVFEADWHGHHVDAYYADHTLIIELDGYRDHRLPDRFEQDRERDALAIELHHDAADHLETTDPQTPRARPSATRDPRRPRP